MANRTAVDAFQVHGVDPQFLIEKITRTRIYESQYWKENCFGLNIETLVDKAVKLDHIGGLFGTNIPTPFLCLVLKMLQLAPTKDIVFEFVRNGDYKYVRALGVFYLRLVGSGLEIYRELEPLLADYRKLRLRNKDRSYTIIHMDEFVDELLTQERTFDTILPRIVKRHVLAETGQLNFRTSLLQDELDNERNSNESDFSDEGNSTKKRLKLNLPVSDDSVQTKDKESLSIEETNALRAKLGLKPLK
ncbi:PRP38-domain-containing protein [Rozella allomycis CSF55]|uniref:Pre-mRNA-splicing factor 38 n=1 Tax=Rozella allomycis (strain CSF55) TaxID=988480 RepID=A0A075AYX0_ROZAC|nr:Pre-mRNA-splicing factor 38 domain-containing protein [Rozella allomycis CSF55]RKP18030.1 PRP38-domain-containing protein [Rozella allomycis CSF55]|eukprot:EPZ35324.1 Pre-mRNA-splicing factor 38 domain-containing protein [Rozella allomycis CSF55]